MAQVEKLSVALTRELTADIRQAVEAGEYASTSEVIREALRGWNLARRQRAAALDELRRLWREGTESGGGEAIDAGDIKRRGRERLAALAKP